MQELLIDIAKLMLALGIGAIIGTEREKSGKPAGSRTLSLVCMSTTFVTLVIANEFPIETAKIVAGVLTGIGFLGAGTIIAHEDKIIGLTTAAAIWTIAIAGVGIGLNNYALALVFSILSYFVLVERRIEAKIKEEEKIIKKKVSK
jgi:putative Mg2+ transporter-C (MgtC) family protein